MTGKVITPGHLSPFVFTDLDGTLLDHETYGYEPALPALARLAEMKIPVVLASSKTQAEMAVIQAEMQLNAPMICENGGGICWPADWAHAQQPDNGNTYHEIRQFIDDLPHRIRFGFSGFGDWSHARLMAETGLPPDMARRAAQRQYSEPGIWTGSDEELAELMAHLSRHGLQLTRGGRFQTICGPASKASRLREICDHYKSGVASKHTIHTIALGDAPNDVAMLQAADQAFIVGNPSGPGIGPLPEEASGKIRRARLPGPAGWNECMLDALDGLDRNPIRHTHESPA